jgi:ABC-type multidrug transport system ATPase subunit
VIVISSEMPEVLHVSDRIVAMYHGRIMREFTSEEVTEDSLIQAISGPKRIWTSPKRMIDFGVRFDFSRRRGKS